MYSMGLLEVDDTLGYLFAPGLEMRELDQILVSEELLRDRKRSEPLS